MSACNQWKIDAVKAIANSLIAYGFDVYLAESKAHGFYTKPDRFLADYAASGFVKLAHNRAVLSNLS